MAPGVKGEFFGILMHIFALVNNGALTRKIDPDGRKFGGNWLSSVLVKIRL